MFKKRMNPALAIGVLLGFTAWVVSAHAQELFYKGKTIRIVVGFSAGGGFDTYSRLIGRHMSKHIPGNPVIIVENMTGAGSLIAANYTYNIAKPDGLTIGNWIGGLVLQEVLGRQGIKFHAPKFEWVGALQDSQACALAKASGITNLRQWSAAKKPVKFGGTAPGSNDVDIPRILEATLGLPIQVVQGYKGLAEVRLAVESGELAGSCATWAGIKAAWSRLLESGEVNVVIQANSKKHPDLLEVPNAVDLAESDETRQLIRMGIHYQSDISRNYSLPPGTPKERVATLQRAFLATVKDREFLEEANKAKLAVDPLPGEEVGKIVSDFFGLKEDLAARLKQIMLAK